VDNVFFVGGAAFYYFWARLIIWLICLPFRLLGFLWLLVSR
jgi:hypothetical protein